MKILLSYPSEHDKTEGAHYCRVLRRLGHEVCEVNVAASVNYLGTAGQVVQGYPSEVTIDALIEEHGKPDLFLYIDPLGLIPRGMESSPIPTACILSDVHRNLKDRQSIAELFDHIFLYQRDYVDKFSDHSPGTVHWFPYACDTQVFRDLGIDRDFDVAFIGQLFGPRSERRRIIETLSSQYHINPQRYYLQHEIPEIYSRAKIVINLPVGGDLNFRPFEALSCGALCLTERLVSGQEELFKDGVHYVEFDNKQDLFEKVKYYLANEEKRKKIAQAGHDEVKQNHSLALRLETLFEKLALGPQKSAPVRSKTKGAVLRLYASIYERSGKVEPLLRLAAEQRHHLPFRLKLLGMGFKSFLRRAVSGW